MLDIVLKVTLLFFCKENAKHQLHHYSEMIKDVLQPNSFLDVTNFFSAFFLLIEMVHFPEM